ADSFASNGRVTYQGVTYPVSEGQLPGSARVAYEALGPALLLPTPTLGEPLTFIFPFTLTGTVLLPACPTCSAAPAVGASRVAFPGGGLATFTFVPAIIIGTRVDWTLPTAEYDIVATPEPSTWLLVTTAAAGLALLGLLRRAEPQGSSVRE